MTIEPPPCLSICRISQRMQFQTPLKSTATVLSNSASEISAIGFCGVCIPALLSAASRRPNFPAIHSTIFSTSPASDTSQAKASAFSPDSASFRACSSGLFMSASTVTAPARANASAHASPIPCAAPVTRATLPFMSSIAQSFRVCFALRILPQTRRAVNARHSQFIARFYQSGFGRRGFSAAGAMPARPH